MINRVQKMFLNLALKILRSKVKDRVPHIIAYIVCKASADGQDKAEIMNEVDRILREGK